MIKHQKLLPLALIALLLLPACQGSQVPTAVPAPAATSTVVSPSAQPPSATAETTAATATMAQPSPANTATAVPSPTANATGADADVLFVRAQETATGWTFHVTVAHPDTGWEDYADGWDVVLPDGTVLKPDPESPFTRLLLHPHETEQPFTRSQSGIVVPAGTAEVRVRAHDLVDGFGGQEILLDWSAAAAGTAVVTDLYEIIPASP